MDARRPAAVVCGIPGLGSPHFSRRDTDLVCSPRRAARRNPAGDAPTLVSFTERDGETVFVVVGALDAGTAPVVAGLMLAVDSGDERFVMDLRRVSLLDEVGVTMLLTEHGRLAGDGRQLILEVSTDPVSAVLDRMGINDIVTIRRSDEIDDRGDRHSRADPCRSRFVRRGEEGPGPAGTSSHNDGAAATRGKAAAPRSPSV